MYGMGTSSAGANCAVVSGLIVLTVGSPPSLPPAVAGWSSALGGVPGTRQRFYLYPGHVLERPGPRGGGGSPCPTRTEKPVARAPALPLGCSYLRSTALDGSAAGDDSDVRHRGEGPWLRHRHLSRSSKPAAATTKS